MRYNLASLTQRTKSTRRKSIPLRPIIAPATYASDLYAAAYAPIIKAWEGAVPEIVAEYDRALAQITTDSPADIGQILERQENDLFRLVMTIRLRLDQWTLRVEKWQRSKWRGAVLSATGVDVGTIISAGGMRMTMAASIERNVSLVKSVSDQTRARIGEAVFQGLTKHLPTREVSASIREATTMGRKRALRIASDQTVKIAAQLNSERRREAGIDTWAWVSSHKVNYRPEHQARDGKRYSDDAPPSDLPGELPYCGCTERAVLSLDGEF